MSAVWPQEQLTLMQNIGGWCAPKLRRTAYLDMCWAEWTSPADACMRDDWHMWICWYYYNSNIFRRKKSTKQYPYCTRHKHSFNQHQPCMTSSPSILPLKEIFIAGNIRHTFRASDFLHQYSHLLDEGNMLYITSPIFMLDFVII